MLNKFWDWFSSKIPVCCDRCGRYILEKDTKTETTTHGYKVILCLRCHAAVFKPFSDIKNR